MTDTIQKEIDDLRIFSDPFEPFEYADRENGWAIRLVREGQTIRLVKERDRIRMMSDGVKSNFMSFRSLLFNRKFANLERLATAQRHETRNLVDEKSGENKTFMACRGEIISGKNTGNSKLEKWIDLSFENVSKLLQKSSDNLRIFVVNGVAGVGKTLLIERLVRERSLPLSYRSGNPLLLHVKSLGKVLTALDDRIAGTLSNLRAGFYGDELNPLVRRNLVHVAIDGFDELSDSRGYERAWGALRDFIRDLGGQGTCILAGRDTTLNRETVRDGLGDTVEESAITILNLDFPEPRDIRAWLSEKPKWRERENREIVKRIEEQTKSIEYLRRPFFISKISEFDPGDYSEIGGDPISYLMDGMVFRESEKLLPREEEHASTGSISDLYTAILSEAARMMMDDESDRIDVEFLRLIAEEVFEGHLNEETKNSLAQRVESFALFESDSNDDGVRVFPHETIRSYFYSKHILDYFPQHGATNAMYRVPLNSEDFRIFNSVVRRVPSSEQMDLRRSMKNALRTKSAIGYFSSNLGGLLLSFMPFEEDQDAFVLADLPLRDVWMADQIEVQKGELIDLSVNKLVAGNADLSGVSFRDVEAYEMFVGPFVKFGENVPNVKSLNLRDVSGRKERIFDVDKIREWMAAHSDQPDEMGAPDERWKLLEKFSRISMQRYWLREGDEDTKRITDSSHWDEVCALLEQHGRLKIRDNVPASGKRTKWFHLVAGDEFLKFEEKNDLQESTVNILRQLNVQ